MQVNVGMSQTNRRQLQKLQNLLAVNENQFQLVTKQIDAQWSTHQTLLKQNSRFFFLPNSQVEHVVFTLVH